MEERLEREAKLKRLERKRDRKELEHRVEELAPKKTGREAMLEKKRFRSSYARMEKDPTVVEVETYDRGKDFEEARTHFARQ